MTTATQTVDALAAILAPMDPGDFLRQAWGRQHVHVRGPRGRFTHLCSWDHLNTVLDTQRMDSPRLRLHKQGSELSARQFRRPSKVPGRGSVLRPEEVVKELAAGATLVVDEIEDTSPPLRALASELTRRLSARVFVNLYAGWGGDNGFSRHWDPQDVFILQVYGRKRWQVWAPTRVAPMIPDVAIAPQPDGPPAFDGELTDGDVLYMPRGWWHFAHPVHEACMHLTVSVTTWTGIDVIAWFAKRLMAAETARQDLPVLADADARRALAGELGRLLHEAWSPDVVDEFLAVGLAELRTHDRAQFCLPDLHVGRPAGE